MGSRESEHVPLDEDNIVRPSAKTSPKGHRAQRKIPSGFKLAGGAKELHGSPIYCVAWSTDVHQNFETTTPAVEPSTEQLTNHNKQNGHVHSQKNSESNANNATESGSETLNSQSSTSRASLLRCLATCGGNHLTVYEVGIPEVGDSSNSTGEGFNLRQAYVDPDEQEIYYACAFGGRSLGSPFGFGPLEDSSQNDNEPVILTETSEETDKSNPHKKTRRELFQDMIDLASFDGPQLLCVAGSRGVIKVVDTVRKMLILTLSGHGDEIYDMKFCPTNDWLLLSASKDESLRLWNVKTATCCAIFAGHEGHRDSILSLGWHPLGDKFLSAGMDTTVKIWNIGEGSEVCRAIELSSTIRPRIKDPSLEKKHEKTEKFRAIYEQMPVFSSNKVHTDYIDCVQFVGDLVLSKSISNTIVLWKPVLKRSSRGANKSANHRLPNEVVALREFSLTKCDVWFVRFQTDIDCQMLAIGNTNGEVKLWEIGSDPTKKHFAYLSHHQCCSTVRMVAFSPDAKCIVASCDDATLWKWDAA